jgi:hypothetical protein
MNRDLKNILFKYMTTMSAINTRNSRQAKDCTCQLHTHAYKCTYINTHKKNQIIHNNITGSIHIMTNSSLITNNLKRLRVSSTLNKNVKEFNKDFMIDGNDETCWNSHQGSPQSILIEFNEPCIASQVHIMFQGGFVGKNCEFWIKKASSNEEDWIKCKSFYPVDNNSMQVRIDR